MPVLSPASRIPTFPALRELPLPPFHHQGKTRSAGIYIDITVNPYMNVLYKYIDLLEQLW